jgi:N-ethylmaleimide reductase
LILCGGYDKESAEAIESGLTDLVAFGRPFINNPDLVERFKKWPLSEDLKTDLFYSADEKDILIIRFIIHCRMITPNKY